MNESEPRLRPGMTARVEIEVEERTEALYVPLEAVFERDGRAVVYLAGRRPRPREVVLGPSNADFVVIEKGLARGDRVLLRDPEAAAPGVQRCAADPEPAPLVALRDVAPRLPARRDAAWWRSTASTSRSARGEKLAIMGPSGSGKTTLLSILGCLDRPTQRRRTSSPGRAVEGLDDDALSRLRNREIGFVFQAFHLIPQLTVAENVETPLQYAGVAEAEWRPRALAALERVVAGATRADHRPNELSGGEAQRAAIARALVTAAAAAAGRRADRQPRQRTPATRSPRLLDELHAAGGTVVLVTHNEALARRAQRVVRLRDGRVESEEVL